MSIETGHRPGNSGDKKKNRWKEIVGGLAALGTAAYFALPNSDSPKPPPVKDTTAERKPDPGPEPDVPLFPPLRPEGPKPVSEPSSDPEPSSLVRPSPKDSVEIDPQEFVTFPPELQGQVNELHKLCSDFYTEDPLTLLHPLRPPIAKQIYQHYTKLADDAKKYPNVPNFSEESFCGNREKFYNRYENLANAVLDSDLSDAAKERILLDLTVSNVDFYNGGFQSTNRMSDFFRNTAPSKEDKRELYQSYLDHGLQNINELSEDEYAHLAFRLYIAKGDHGLEILNGRQGLFSDDENKKITEFITPYLYNNALSNQSERYHSWEDSMNNPPAEGSDQKIIEDWERDRDVALIELIKSIENSIDEGLTVDPREYGCKYTLQELKAMRDDLEGYTDE